MIITVIQSTISVLLIASILLQHRGSGLGAAFGGGDTVTYTRRGAEKFLHWSTIILALFFLASSFLNLVY